MRVRSREKPTCWSFATKARSASATVGWDEVSAETASYCTFAE